MIIVILYYLINFSVAASPQHINANENADPAPIMDQDCIEVHRRDNMIPTGWPYRSSCTEMAQDFGYYILIQNITDANIKKLNSKNGTCIVQDVSKNTTLWIRNIVPDDWSYYQFADESYFHTFMEDESSNFRILFKVPAANYCSYRDLTTRKLSENDTCESFQNEYGSLDRGSLGGQYHFTCDVPSDVFPKVTFEKTDLKDVTYEWTRNCSEINRENVIFNGNKMTLHSIDYSNAGIYTCAIIYKGRKRYVTSHNFCVRHPDTSGEKISMKCPTNAEGIIGEDMMINCSIDMGLGKANPTYYLAHWVKYDYTGARIVSECQKPGELVKMTEKEEPRTGCIISVSDLKDECYLFEPSMKEQEPRQDHAHITLFIRNLQSSDLGSYSLEFGMIDDSLKSNITLSVDEDHMLRSNATGVGFGVGLLILSVIILFLCVLMKNDLLWVWKKWFASYEKDTQSYTAYLAYYYSNEEQSMGALSRRLTVKLLGELFNLLDSLGATIYDDTREGSGEEYRVENIVEVQKNCDRVIIILSVEYMTDHWSLYKTYQALQHSIEVATKIIFIILPNVKSSLEEIPLESRTTLKTAMRLGTTIPWSGEVPLSGKFRRRVEIALPKKKSSRKLGVLDNSKRRLISLSDTSMSETPRSFSNSSDAAFAELSV